MGAALGLDFDSGPATSAAHPAIDALDKQNELISPVRYATVVYRWRVDPSQAVTATLVTLSDTAGALAAFNGWIAAFGFMPAIERTALAMGDQAETLELGWPSVHQLIARDRDRFLLVEADAAIPPDVQSHALREIAERTLAAQ
jgi:hypothetical protein